MSEVKVGPRVGKATEAAMPEATSESRVSTYRSLHSVAAAQQQAACCLQGSGWDRMGARYLSRPRNSEPGPRPERKLPKETEAAEGTGRVNADGF